MRFTTIIVSRLIIEKRDTFSRHNKKTVFFFQININKLFNVITIRNI